MTVASRPVFGQTCQSPSAAMSMPSSHTHQPVECAGLTPDQWQAVPDQWPAPYIAVAASALGSNTTTGGTTTATSGTTTTTTTTASTGTSTSGGSLLGTYSTRTSGQSGAFGGTLYQGTGFTTGTTTTQSGTLANQGSTLFDGNAPTPYHSATTGLGGRVFGNRSMMNVIGMAGSGGNLDSLGRYVVAALLNARSGRTPVLDEGGVRNMWNDLVHRGYYEPTAGVRWSAPQIVAYLKTTMG